MSAKSNSCARNIARMRLLALLPLTPLCAAFAPPPAAPRILVQQYAEPPPLDQTILKPDDDLLTQEQRADLLCRSKGLDPDDFDKISRKIEQDGLVETFKQGLERHPTMVKSVAARTKELLEDERENLDDESLPAKFDMFFNGLVRHPAMLWGTFLRTMELMEEELIEAGDAESAAKADTIRQVRIAAEAVKGSREL